MFTQTENPFCSIVTIYNSPIKMESGISNNSSNIWKWILTFFILMGGFIIFFVWNENIMKVKKISKELKDEKSDKNINQNV